MWLSRNDLYKMYNDVKNHGTDYHVNFICTQCEKYYLYSQNVYCYGNSKSGKLYVYCEECTVEMICKNYELYGDL
jgi:hypothetical protein